MRKNRDGQPSHHARYQATASDLPSAQHSTRRSEPSWLASQGATTLPYTMDFGEVRFEFLERNELDVLTCYHLVRLAVPSVLLRRAYIPDAPCLHISIPRGSTQGLHSNFLDPLPDAILIAVIYQHAAFPAGYLPLIHGVAAI